MTREYRTRRDASRNVFAKDRKFYSASGTFESLASARTAPGREQFIFRPDLDEEFRQVQQLEHREKQQQQRAQLISRLQRIEGLRAKRKSRHRRNDLTARLDPGLPPPGFYGDHTVRDRRYWNKRHGQQAWHLFHRVPQNRMHLLLRPTIVAADLEACEAIRARVLHDAGLEERELEAKKLRVADIRQDFRKQARKNAQAATEFNVPIVKSPRPPTRPIVSPRTQILACVRPEAASTRRLRDPLNSSDYTGLLLHEATLQRSVTAKRVMKQQLERSHRADASPSARSAAKRFDDAVTKYEEVREGPAARRVVAALRGAGAADASPETWETAASVFGPSESALARSANGASPRAQLRVTEWAVQPKRPGHARTRPAKQRPGRVAESMRRDLATFERTIEERRVDKESSEAGAGAGRSSPFASPRSLYCGRMSPRTPASRLFFDSRSGRAGAQPPRGGVPLDFAGDTQRLRTKMAQGAAPEDRPGCSPAPGSCGGSEIVPRLDLTRETHYVQRKLADR